MSPVEGNAWAQMKAREQEQRQAGLDREPTPKPASARNFSGLDYGAELALPMPKPRRRVRPEDISAPITSPTMLSNITKKRSTTEPSLPTGRNSKCEASEKKKSKVATLRSKFSLKDIGKEFRKEIPPLSSMPKLGGGSGNQTERPSSDGDGQPKSTHNFNEVRLYMPKPKKGDVHPNSAPPHTSEFPISNSPGKLSEDSIISCPSMRTPTKASLDGKTKAKIKHSLVHSADTSQGTKNARLETLLHDGSSSLPCTGEYNNTGQSELIQVHDRVPSMKAENNQSAVPSMPQTPPPPPFSDAAAYSPSIYDTPKTVDAKASVSSLQEKIAQAAKHPFIVSSSDYKEKALKQQTEDQLFMDPREPPLPPLLPNKSRARDEVRNKQGNIAVDEGQYFTGVTSHGGYAPPPPHPGYQNTMTLEQQLASHVDSLHYHVNTAVNKLTRTSENNCNWSTDQVLKQVDNMFDLTRVINARAVTQEEIIKEIPRLLMDARIQVNMAQQETLMMEERMKVFVQQEISKLKNEISELILPSASVASSQVQAQDWKLETPNAGAHGGPKPTRDGEKRFQPQNKKKPRPMQMKRDDGLASSRAADSRKPEAEHNQRSKPAPIRQAEATTDKEPNEQSLGDGVPPPTAVFRTPKPQVDRAVDPVSTKREKPREESSGSPKPKAAKLRFSSPKPVATPQRAAEGSKGLESNNSPSPQRESDSQPRSVFSSEDLKTPEKKGGMLSGFRRKCDSDSQSGSRFFRTPRRTKEGKSVSSQESQSPRFAISTPVQTHAATIPTNSAPSATSNDATPTTAGGAQIRREESPSLIHPALRNQKQKQVMADRERRLGHANRQFQAAEHGQVQEPGHPLQVSHSHHNIGTISPSSSFVGYDTPNPGYASGMPVTNSSALSFRGVRHYQSDIQYPCLSATPPLPFDGREVGQSQYFSPHPVHPHSGLPSLSHSHSHGQFERAEWYGNGNGMAEESVHPGGNFF